MKKAMGRKNLPQIVAICVNILLFFAVVYLMNYVQELLNSDSKINLTEIVTQNESVITSKLNLEVNNVNNVANTLSNVLKDKEINPETLLDGLKGVINVEDEEKIFVANTDGIAVFEDGSTTDISGRKYYRLSLGGTSNISDKLIARTNGNEVFIISVPLKVEGKIIGTVQKFYSIQEMYDLCSLSLYSSQGSMNIINKDGYILVSSQSDQFETERDNYFRSLYLEGNEKQSTQLEEDVKKDIAGFMELKVNGKDSFSAYTPIEGIHDWYLITSVAKSAVSPNGNIVIKMFYVILISIVVVFGASMSYFLYFKNKQHAELEKLAFVDNITKGDTYTKFIVEFQLVMKYYPDDVFYLLKFDIDNFKYINNYYGFDFGDEVLFKTYQNIANKLGVNEWVSRVYSDHFIVLLKNDVSTQRLEDLMHSIEHENEFQLYFSAGLYKVNDREESLSLMIDKASAAASKSKGSLIKKVEVYNEEFDKQMIENEQMKRAVKEAINKSEIIPFYQPKVDVNTNQIVGAEALARWINSEGKMIFPDQFIPLCEKSGLIIDLDIHIFTKVLVYLRERLDTNKECVPVSVNFSRNHLLDKEFVPKILNLMKKYDIPMNLIEIELTESAFFNNLNVMNQFIYDLHSVGFIVSMDDFGSGYSSLNMLKDVEVDVLKIDREFLIGTENSDKQKIIFSAISQMAKQLRIRVVVEGVETEENIEMMKTFGCSIAQGYFYAKPMSQSDFDKYMEEK